MENLLNDFIYQAEKNNFYILEAQIRRGGLITDSWARFPARPRFEVYSVAKTFTAVGTGIALEEGLLSLDDRLGDFFKEETYDIINENALNITVRDLLTMRAGLSETMFWRDGYERKHERDWVRCFFKTGKFDNKPGSEFLYNNACTYMLSAIISKKTGKNLREYLRYRLFEPIGINNVEWGSCPMGNTLAANGLVVNADELGQFGQLLANGGVYNKKRILSEAFIKEMTTPYTITEEYIPGNPPKKAGYGYQVWIDMENKGFFMGGIFGQYCIVLPEKDTVITIISLDSHDAGSNGQPGCETLPLRRAIWEQLVANI